jgi:hypothetical protein
MKYITKYLESIRQYLFPRMRVLEQELAAVLEAHAVTSAELTNVREELQRTHEADAQLLTDLRQQVRHIESERSKARYQADLLEHSLADIEQSQKSAVAHIATLETKLGEEHNRYETSMHARENSLEKMQDEQKSLQKQQSGLANTFHHDAMRLLESMQVENKKPQQSLLQLTLIAGVLFLTGTLAGALTMQNLQDSSLKLAGVERDIRDMRVFVKDHINNQAALLKELTLALNRQTSGEQALVREQQLEPEEEAQEADKQLEEVVFTPDVSELQANLITLGFDLGMSKPNGELGTKTRQALQEFRQFYLPQSNTQDGVTSEPLVFLIQKSADLARADAARFKIGSNVLAAIRQGSIRTGVDFAFLMELARVETNFNPTARAPTSTATGLFQFKENPWLEAIRDFGANYGLKDYAAEVELINGEGHKQHTIAHDPLQLKLLALRLNPRLSTLLAAENIKRNLQHLSYKTTRELNRTDLYLSHFLGLSGALMFLQALNEEPAAIAGEIFPGAATRNRNVFVNRKKQPRTVAEVYRWFDNKFNTARYDERNPG